MNISEYTNDFGFDLEEAYLASTTSICPQCQQEFDDVENCYSIHESNACLHCMDQILKDQLDDPNQFLLESDSEFDKVLYEAAEGHNTLVLDWN